MLNTFNYNLDSLRRIGRKEVGIKPDVVDLTAIIDGVADIKLRHHFQGKKVKAYRIRVGSDLGGNPTLPYHLDAVKNFQVCWAAPGEGAINALEVEGMPKNISLTRLLETFGITIDHSKVEKLHKRLKRALLVACYASHSEPSIIVNEDDALPVPFIDGCFLIDLATAKKMVKNANRREKLKAYDTIQASLAWSEGLAKGTAILMPNLEADVIVQRCNIKTEARFERPLLTIEGFQHGRTPCTDVQTMINLGGAKTLERVFKHHFENVGRIADDPKAADQWYQDHFHHHDWWKVAIRNYINKGKELPEMRPNLSIAYEIGLKNISHSPVLKEQVYKYACRTLDIRNLKARMPKGEAVAGYLIPDVSRIDSRGYLKDDPVALKLREISTPFYKGNHVSDGPAVTTRNPNAWGEATMVTVRNKDRKKYQSRTAIQISPEDAQGNILQIWGGADMDDSISVWSSPDLLEAFQRSEEERITNDIPRIDLEKYIDGGVQDGRGFQLTRKGQLQLAIKQSPMHLGQIVNFLMNLRICKQYEWYRRAAACEDFKDSKGNLISSVLQLRTLYDMYNKTNPIWADVFAPDKAVVEEEGWDPYAKVPMEKGEYIPYIPCRTDLGVVVRRLIDVMATMWDLEHSTNLLHDGTTLQSKEGSLALQDMVKNQASKIRGFIIHWAWKAMTSNVPPKPLPKDLYDRFLYDYDWEAMSKDRSPAGFPKKRKEWGRVVGRILTGDEDKDKEIAAFTGLLFTQHGVHWDRETGSNRLKYGIDSAMWNPTYDEDGTVMEKGLAYRWAQVLNDL